MPQPCCPNPLSSLASRAAVRFSAARCSSTEVALGSRGAVRSGGPGLP